jgi:hypothetical protein
MAEARERVVIEVEIDADISNDLAAIERRLKSLEDRQNALNRATRGASSANRDFDATNRRLNKAAGENTRKFDRFRTVLGRFGSGLKKVTGFLQKFLTTFAKLSFIAVAAEIAVFTAGLLAVKALLITGRVAVQGYNIALKGLSVTAAGIAAGLATAAAAIREFQEVQLTPFFGGGQLGARGARQLNRSFNSQTRSLLGESTGAVAGSFAQAGIRRGNVLANQLFNLSGGDAKAVQSLAAAFASAQKSGDTAGLITALQGARGFRADSIAQGASLSSIVGTVSRGGATADAFQGLGEAFAGTFIGTLKAEAESFKSIFANIGEPLLKPFRDAFLQISQIIRNDVLGIAQIMREFGPDSMAPALVGFTDAVSDFIRSNIVQNVSNIAGAADKFINFFRSVGNFFTGFGDWLRSYEGAADVVIEMFKAMFGRSANGLFRDFSNLIEDNKETFIGFGDALGNVLNAIKQGFLSGQRGFFGSLPKLTNTLNVVATSVLPNLYDVMGAIAPLFESFPAIIRDVSEKLGPMLVRIFEAMKPIFDKLPEAFQGLMKVLTALEPLIMLLIKAVDLLLSVFSAIPGGDVLMGLGALYMLGTPAGKFFSKFGGRTGQAMAGAGGAARTAAGGAGAGAGAAGAAGSQYAGGFFQRNAMRYLDMRTNPTGRFAVGTRFGGSGAGRVSSFMDDMGYRIASGQGTGLLTRIDDAASLRNGRIANAYTNIRAGDGRFSIGGKGLNLNAAKGLTLLAGAMGAKDFFDVYRSGSADGGGFRGGMGALGSYAENSPLSAGLSAGGVGAALSMLTPVPGLGLLLGGGVTTLGSAAQAINQGSSTGNTLTGIAGATALGAGLGSIIPGAGTVAGAAVGAIAGTIGFGGLHLAQQFGLFGGTKGDRQRKRNEDFAAGMSTNLSSIAANGGTDAQFMEAQSLLQSAEAAMMAGMTADGFTEGDTNAMRTFLMQAQTSGLLAGTEFANMDFTQMHLDDFIQNELGAVMESLTDTIESETARRQREEEERLRKIDVAVGDLSETLEVSRGEIERFVSDFGIALDTANLAGVETLFELYNAPMIDLAQGFLPDLTTTTAYGMEARASTNASLNALADADRLGQYNTADLQQFINDYTSTEVAFGGNAAVSGLSAIMELKRQVETGGLSEEFSSMFELDELLANTAQEMATSFGVPVENIMSLITGPGADVDNVTAYLNEVSRTREIARAGVFGTGTAEQRDAYLDANAAELVNDQRFQEILRRETGLETGPIGSYEDLLRGAAEEGNLPAIMQAYLSEVGDGTDLGNQLLQGILEAVEGVAPMVSIDGEPSTRVSQNGSEYSFTISVAPVSTEG